MKIRCPNCLTIRELPHEEKFSCSFECSCGHTFPADDENVLEEYSEIDLSLPEHIGGYPIESLIGLGGMGKVCKGLHKKLHVPVAIKLLRRELVTKPAAREKFLATSQLCAQLDSPHIVKIYDCGMEGETPYLVMEYLGGGTALDILEANGPFTPEMCARVALDVCAGLEDAEAFGLVHRDLKPDNIMFASDSSVRIMDLGLAFLREDSGAYRETAGNTGSSAPPRPAAVIGTAHYMPPEQIRDPASCDSRSDLYALGITMYQLVTGSLPFDDPDHEKVREMQIRELPKPPSFRRKDLPGDLEKIILRAMEKDPSSRYENARSMMADLEAFLHHRVLPSSFRIISGKASAPSGMESASSPPLPRWQERMILYIQKKLPPSFRENHQELWHYLSTTPQLHLLRLLVELAIVILLAIASAFFWH